MSVFKESKAYRPFMYPWAAEAAQRHIIDMYWECHQINMQDDVQQYFSESGLQTSTVSHQQNKQILDRTLCLFTEMDKTVGEGYTKLLPNIKNNEIRNMLMIFAAREVTHQRAYAMAAETFGFSNKDWLAFSDYVEMVEKLDVMSEDMVPSGASVELDSAIKLSQILLGEGIGLFAAFATLLNFKRQGVLVGFNDINEWSLKDEQEHVLNNIKVLKEMRKCLNEKENIILDETIASFVKAFEQAEFKFIDLVFEMGGAEGLTAKEMKDYIVYLCHLRLYQLGIVEASDIPPNPLDWMEWLLSGNKHANFFEKKVVDYTHGGLEGDVNYSKYLGLVS